MPQNGSTTDGQPRNGKPTRRTELAMPLADRLVLFVGLPTLVVTLGLLLPILARWALSLNRALFFKPVLRFIGAIDQPWEIAVNLGVWVVLTMAIAFSALSESLKLSLTDEQIAATKEQRSSTLQRVEVSAVFLDGKTLVILDNESRPLLQEEHGMSAQVLEAAFRDHGYPWHETDPFAALYQEWTPGVAGLPLAANDVLSARAAALRKKARTEARTLKGAVEKLGYMVRDEGGQQYWRPLVRS